MENNAAANQAFQEYVNSIIETKNPSFDLSNFPNASQLDFWGIQKAWEAMPWLESVNLSNINLPKLMNLNPQEKFLIEVNFGFSSLSGITSLTLDNCDALSVRISDLLANLKNLTLRNSHYLAGISIAKNIKLESLDVSFDTLEKASEGSMIMIDDYFPQSITTLKCSNNLSFGLFFEKYYFELMNLKVLHADGTGLKKTPTFSDWHSLNALYLQNNAIEDITSLKELPTLEISNLSNNKIQDIAPLTNLTNLLFLNLDNNKIEDIQTVSLPMDLQKLQLSDNPIKNLGPLSILSNLSVLHLNNCPIEAGQLAKISDLTQLTELRMRHCGIENVDFLSGLSKLKILELSDNRIADILPFVHLYNSLLPTAYMDSMDLQNNKIREIEPFAAFDRLIDLNVKGNPVKDYPTERLETLTIAKLKIFFTEPRTEVNSHTKLILFGNSGVGKTNLNSVLISNRFKDKQNSTDGIEISQWTVKDSQNRDLRVNIWDFGGQEYYHGTHRLFLTQNSVFALLWNKKTNHFDKIKTNIYLDNVKTETELDHFHYDYWLDNIAFYSPKTQNTEGSSLDNIFLIQNLFDTEQKSKTLPSDMDSKGIKEALAFNLKEVPNKKNDARKNRKWFDVFREELIDTLEQNAAAEKMTVKEAEIQAHFVELFEATILNKNIISSTNPFAFVLKNQKNYFEWDELFKACQSVWDALTEKRLHRLLSFLQTKGVVTYLRYFKQTDERRVVFFNQKWLLDKINHILNKDVRDNKGIFERKNVENLVGKALTDDFIELMERYNIAVKLKTPAAADAQYLTPQYLPNDNSLNVFFNFAINNSNAESLTLRLPVFYYRNAMLRLIWLYGAELTAEQRNMLWKNGIFFTDSKTQANVFVHGSNFTGDNECDITIAIANKEHKETIEIQLLEDIFGTFNPDYRLYQRRPMAMNEQINKQLYIHQRTSSIEDFKHVKDPQLRGRIKLSVKKSAFISVEQIIKQSQSEMSFALDADNKRVPIKLFESCLKTLGLKQPKPSVFISYKHHDKDIPMFEELLSHLNALKRSTEFDIWTDRNLKTGSEWDDEIQGNLKSSEVFVMLISAEYFASNYIYNNEMWKARLGKGVKIVPILLRKCPIPPDIDALQFAAKDELGRRKPLQEWTYIDQAWVDIANTIKEYLAV